MDQLRSELTPRQDEGARRTGVLIGWLLVGATALGCVPTEGPAEPPIPLSHTVASPEALGQGVLDALVTKDRTRLDELALSETEFRDVVWPELPSSRPEVGLPFAYAWGDLHQKSLGHLRTAVAALGGRRFELVGVRFLGETTDYGRFRVHRESALDVRTESGETTRIRVFGSMIEYAGRVKVFSYVVD
jgi:hypothetical protein